MNVSEVEKLDVNKIVEFSLALQTNVAAFYNQTFNHIVNMPQLNGIINGSIPHHNAAYLRQLFRNAFPSPHVTVSDLSDIVKKLDHPDSTPNANIVIYTLTAVTTCIVTLRMYARHKYCGGIRGNDWMLLIALFVQYINEAVQLTAANLFGAGKHVYDVTYRQYKYNLMFCYICQLLYFPNLLLVKLSLLLFYMELSPHHIFRRVVLTTGAIFIVITIAYEFAVVFQCKPIDFWNYPSDYICVNRLALFRSMGIINIITDFVIFFMPVAVVIRLKLKLREKIIVISLFGLGAFACITSVFRLFSLVEFASSLDVNYTEAEIAVWSLLEFHLTVMAASIPSLKSLFVHYAPRLMGYSSSKQSSYASSGKPGSSDIKTFGSIGGYGDRIINSRNGGGSRGGGKEVGLFTMDNDAEDLEMNLAEYRSSNIREDLLRAGSDDGDHRLSAVSKSSSKHHDEGRDVDVGPVESTVSLGSGSSSQEELSPGSETGLSPRESGLMSNRSSGMTDSGFSIHVIPPPPGEAR